MSRYIVKIEHVIQRIYAVPVEADTMGEAVDKAIEDYGDEHVIRADTLDFDVVSVREEE